MTRWIVRSVYPEILPMLALSLLDAHCLQQTEQHTEANRTVRFINCTMTFRIVGPGVRTKASSLLPIKKLFTISCIQWMVAHRLMREYQACPDNTTMKKVKWISGSRFKWIQFASVIDWNVSQQCGQQKCGGFDSREFLLISIMHNYFLYRLYFAHFVQHILIENDLTSLERKCVRFTDRSGKYVFLSLSTIRSKSCYVWLTNYRSISTRRERLAPCYLPSNYFR